jgi:uncharacterized HAD superfamily protein
VARIGIDLDGCAYDFTRALRHYLVEHEGYNPMDLPDSTCWDFFLHDWNMTLENYLRHFAAGVDAGVIFLHGEAEQDAAKYISQLKRDGHQIHIVTHRQIGTKSISNTGEWLAREGIEFDTLTFAKDKTVLPTDFFIEDNVDNFLALEAAGTRVVLMDRPWNSHHDTPYRVSGWAEFYDFIKTNTED